MVCFVNLNGRPSSYHSHTIHFVIHHVQTACSIRIHQVLQLFFRFYHGFSMVFHQTPGTSNAPPWSCRPSWAATPTPTRTATARASAPPTAAARSRASRGCPWGECPMDPMAPADMVLGPLGMAMASPTWPLARSWTKPFWDGEKPPTKWGKSLRFVPPALWKLPWQPLWSLILLESCCRVFRPTWGKMPRWFSSMWGMTRFPSRIWLMANASRRAPMPRPLWKVVLPWESRQILVAFFLDSIWAWFVLGSFRPLESQFPFHGVTWCNCWS